MNAIFDRETSELRDLGALKYLNIAKQERAVRRAREAFDDRPRPDALAVEALRRYYEAFREFVAMRDSARAAFAEKLQWRPGKPFSLDELRAGDATGLFEPDLCDAFVGLADYFYDGDDKPVGVVGHTRRTWQECRDFGTRQDLRVEALEGCWYDPGTLNAVLLTRRSWNPPRSAQ